MIQQPKRLCIHGFDTYEQQKVLQKLEKESLITIVHWFGDIPDATLSIRKINRLKFTLQTGKRPYDTFYNEIEDSYLKTFIDMYARERYTNATFHEYQHIFSLYYTLFAHYLYEANIELIFFSNLPHFGADLVLYALAKKLEILVLITHQSQFSNRFYTLDDINNYHSFLDNNGYNNPVPIQNIQPTFKKHLFYMNIKKRNFFPCLKPLLLKDLKMGLKGKRGRTIAHALVHYSKCKTFRKRLEKAQTIHVDFSKKYVYFALHWQPELTTTAIGGRYSDQIRAIETLSQLIPDDYYIYVKENPKQTWYQRDELFFKRLSIIPNTIYLSNQISTYELIENSQFIATISGTVGWEAISGGKNALIFGQAWYQNLPGVFHYTPKLKFEEIINYTITHKALEIAYNKHLNKKTYAGLVDISYKALVKDFSSDQAIETLYNSLHYILSNPKGSK
ncbi:MAG: hypothetical protein IE889_01240 [Campylobacterales bacterium]|nr:hypothetical protein [Campylobacterales bacterium]